MGFPPPPHASTRRLERLLSAVALLFLGVWSLGRLDASVYEWVQGRRLDGVLGRQWNASSRPSKSRSAAATRGEVGASGLIGRIEIPRLGVRAIVTEGTDSRTLHRSVGHVPGTALPGESGNVAIAGHRDSFFSHLMEARSGDRVSITTPDGVFEYSIESKSVVLPEQTDVLEATDSPTLTLITCYPFHYLGPAPKRYVVRARQVATPGGEPFEAP